MVIFHQSPYGEERHIRGRVRLFDVGTGRLVWSAEGSGRAFNLTNWSRFAELIAKRTVEELAHEGFFPPPSPAM